MPGVDDSMGAEDARGMADLRLKYVRIGAFAACV